MNDEQLPPPPDSFEGISEMIKTHDKKTDKQHLTLMEHNRKDKESHLRTQTSLESTAATQANLAISIEKLAKNQEVTSGWMMKEITENRKGFIKANWKLLAAISIIVGAVFTSGVLIAVLGG